MVIFRENTEDIYAGIEAEAGSPEAETIREMIKEVFGREISEDSGLGIKPVSEQVLNDFNEQQSNTL